MPNRVNDIGARSELRHVKRYPLQSKVALMINKMAKCQKDTVAKLGLPIMTSNPNFTDYVERVQQNLAVFSLPDETAKQYLMESKDLASYGSSFIAFEILFNERIGQEKRPERKFDPHVSDNLFSKESAQSCIEDLKRLYINLKGVNLADLDWSVPEYIEQDEYLSDTTKKSLKALPDNIGVLNELYEKFKNSTPNQIFEQDPDVLRVKEILGHLLQRYEVQYIPTNVGTTALIYEAWKQGKLVPLGNPFEDKEEFERLLSGLFINTSGKRHPDFVREMAENLGLNSPRVRQIKYAEMPSNVEPDRLSNGKTWISTLEGWEWYNAVESSLIHKVNTGQNPSNSAYRYLAYYPLIVDDYWFAGVAFIYSDLNVDPSDGDIPEVFNRKKYSKIYNTIKSVSDTLRLSLREEALKQAEKKLREGSKQSDVFCEVVRDYFVCFNVRKVGEENNSHTNKYEIYVGHGIQIFGPAWLPELPEKLKLIKEEIDGYDASVPRVTGLYKLVNGLAEKIAKEREERFEEGLEEGIDRQSQKFSHQAAGLMQIVLDDAGVQALSLGTRASLWHLQTLIQVWGTIDLKPMKSITETDFVEWGDESVAEVMEKIADFSLAHALWRATSRRSGATASDRKERQQALQILRTVNHPVNELKQRLRLASPICEWPDWAISRGFVLCFHHAFWQAAYHGFRALCGNYPPLPETHNAYLQVSVRGEQIEILNAAVPFLPEENTLSRDAAFFDDVNQRLQVFTIGMPTQQNGYWITTISRNF